MIVFSAHDGYVWQSDLALWSGVVFVLLVVLLAKFAAPSIVAAMHSREQSIVDSLRQADIALNEAAIIREQHEKARVASRQAAAALVVEAKRDAAQMRTEHVARARTEADRIAQRARREITLARRKALDELWMRTTDLSATLAEKLVASRLTPDDHRRLVNQAISEIGNKAEVRL